jgi:hypothetical protein
VNWATRWPPHPSPLPRGERETSDLFQMKVYSLQDTVQIGFNLRIPKPDNCKTTCFQKLSAFSVIDHCTFFSMLGAVQFNNQMPFKADEVDDIATNRPLSAKLEIHETIPKSLPEHTLVRCLTSPQCASSLNATPVTTHGHTAIYRPAPSPPVGDSQSCEAEGWGEGATGQTQIKLRWVHLPTPRTHP